MLYKHLQATFDALNLQIIDFTGEEFEAGLPILPINLGDFYANDVLSKQDNNTCRRHGNATELYLSVTMKLIFVVKQVANSGNFGRGKKTCGRFANGNFMNTFIHGV